MGIAWRHNGKTVTGPEAIPDCPLRGPAMVRASYTHPIEMQSMGFIADPADVAEHRKRFPGVELRLVDGSAIPVMRSLGEKRDYLKRNGWIEKRSY